MFVSKNIFISPIPPTSFLVRTLCRYLQGNDPWPSPWLPVKFPCLQGGVGRRVPCLSVAYARFLHTPCWRAIFGCRCWATGLSSIGYPMIRLLPCFVSSCLFNVLVAKLRICGKCASFLPWNLAAYTRTLPYVSDLSCGCAAGMRYFR